jgi:TolB-like protein/DNA-binding winged helix-turn-helix (wHTH) protein
VEAHVAGETLWFEGWQFDRHARRLFRQDATGAWMAVSIGSRALDILALLLERPGTLVFKEAIMDAVWPHAAVEANNLTVQISALRHVLDHDRTEGSCIQTVPGRGYRFVVPVFLSEELRRLPEPPPTDGDAGDDAPGAETGGERAVTTSDTAALAEDSPGPDRPSPDRPGPDGIARRRRRGVWFTGLLTGLCVAIGTLLLVGLRHSAWRDRATDRPRLSMVVMPFENLSGDPKDDYLADGITDDLTSDLASTSGAFVIARQSAYFYKGKSVDVRKVGNDLGVRYVIEGSVRKIESTLRINVELTSAETGAQLWSDRFDEQITDMAAGQEEIVARMSAGLGISMVDIESARSLRERPTRPDAFDLILRARSLGHLPPSLQQYDETKALFERALALDPASVDALTGVGLALVDRAELNDRGRAAVEDIPRAEQLLTQARAIAPYSEYVLNLSANLLHVAGRWQEGISVAKELIQRYPNSEVGYFELAQSLIAVGQVEEAIPLEEMAVQLNPRSPWLFARYRDIGCASVLLGKDQDAITFSERSLVLNPDNSGFRATTYRRLAAAYARSGQLPAAKHALAEADRLKPYETVRTYRPCAPLNTIATEQIRRDQDALRLAGERDHADEDADFRVPADAELHNQFAGPTPTIAPGAKTIRTAELVPFLAQVQPVLIDTVAYSSGRSVPGAVGLQNAGPGGSFADAAQDRLSRKMQELTKGDLSKPIVAVGWNSERFDGRNLALRLVTLGYAKVYWYRGGREAWEAANLPETDLLLQEW